MLNASSKSTLNVISQLCCAGTVFRGSSLSDALTAEGLATEIEAQRILTELNHAAADSETVISLPRIVQVWGQAREWRLTRCCTRCFWGFKRIV
jgi:hypothetical protein